MLLHKYGFERNRLKNLKNFLDHVLLLFEFEKNILIKKALKILVGHPLLETEDNQKLIYQIYLAIKKK